MKLGVVKRILKENLGGDLPSWLDGFLTPLNQFMEQVYSALNQKLTFADNFSCSVVTLEFQHAVAKDVNPQRKGKVIGIIPISTGSEVLDAYGYTITSTGSVSITIKFANTSAKETCTVVILFG